MLGNQQLVELTGLPKATVSRLTSTLVSLGYLRTDLITRKHFMGTRLLGMGASVQRRIGLQRIARPYMTQLSAETGLTITLGTRDRLGLVILEVIRPPAVHRLVTNIDVGTVLPLASTALGLAYIVAAPIREQTQILESLRSRFSDEWPILRQRIEQAHSEYLRHGFGGCAEFCVNGQSTAGASRPVRKHHEHKKTRRTRRTAVWPAGQLQEARRPDW